MQDLTGRVAVAAGVAGDAEWAMGEIWIMAPGGQIDAQIQGRRASIHNRTDPTYRREVPR